jgi:hypothetical protein
VDSLSINLHHFNSILIVLYRCSYNIDLQDPHTVYGFAYAYLKLDDAEQAQKHFQQVLEMVSLAV